jgi:signal transduction histidine kinase
MIDIQNSRYERIVAYFQEVYRKEGRLTENSGIELMHEAYMGNYCLTLLDSNGKPLWGMNPNDIKNNPHLNSMLTEETGVYSSKRFNIEVDNKIVGYVDIGQYSSVLLSEDDVNFKLSINKSIIASGILTLIIIVSISMYFSKQFSTPIKEVSNMSVNLSKGNFNAKYKTKSNIEELEKLRKSVNILAEKLQYQDSLRKKLVSDISHEIRTPLNILQNNLEAMVDGIFPVTTERLNNLNEEVIRFGRLLDNLNSLKEFEEESIKLNFERINLAKLLEDIYSDFSVAAESKNIKLDYIFKSNEKYFIKGDNDKLKQVFINLLSNAIKFTENGGNVSINIYSTSKNIIVEVRDNGIGIKQEDIPFIFERLYRGDKSRNLVEGSGIGLTIVKNILKLHYASIEVDSKEGEGTSFKVYFEKETELQQ